MKRRDMYKVAAAVAVAAVSSKGAVAQQQGCGVATKFTTQAQQKYLQAARRMPKLPARDTIAPDELDAYDKMVKRVDGFKRSTEIIDGLPYGVPHMEALGVSPAIGSAISGDINTSLNHIDVYQNKPGRMTGQDHETIDLILAFDSGYYSLIALHTPSALAQGMRIEAIEAMRDRRDDLLTPVERDRVAFVRAVRDGTMTDELWEKTQQRLGSERGVVEYLHHVLLLEYHHKFCWACGVPEMPKETYAKMLNEYKTGVRKMPALRTS
jgi:hypothetical protein